MKPRDAKAVSKGNPRQGKAAGSREGVSVAFPRGTVESSSQGKAFSACQERVRSLLAQHPSTGTLASPKITVWEPRLSFGFLFHVGEVWVSSLKHLSSEMLGLMSPTKLAGF